jgi:hypothetical protein
MIFAILLIGFGMMMIFAPRLAFLLLRIVWLFLPEIIGSMVFLHVFLWLDRKSSVASASGHFTFLVIGTLILGAVVGRKMFLLYVFPYLPRGLFKGKNNGRD